MPAYVETTTSPCSRKTTPSPARSKMPLKGSNEVIYKIDLLMEKMRKRLTFSDLRLSERFPENRLRILFHFRTKYSSEQWACCLLPEMAIKPLAYEKIIRSYPDKVAVLVDVVRIVKGPKRRVSALVWFDPVDSFYRRFPRSCYFSSLEGVVFLGCIEDGKCYELPSALAYPPALSSLNQLESKMIQGATQVLDNVSGNGQHLKSGDRQSRKILLSLQSLRISIGANYTLVSVPKIGGCDIEINEVFFGPFDFYANENQSGLSGEILHNDE
jgi:hypothetical protein